MITRHYLKVLCALVLLVLFSTTVSAQSRWGTTATDGSGLGLGDATTITWGFVQDGTNITPAFSGESSDTSELIQFFDTNIGAGAGGADLTNRPWWSLFDQIFDRWSAVSGLNFEYEANDSGATIQNGGVAGQLGVNADVRIGGHSIDGQTNSNTLAYNYFPNNGDMVIDTDNVTFFSDTTNDDGSDNNYLGLRNVLAHEFGHGMGLPHFESNDSQQLMEPFIDLDFDGPQIDDIFEAQRRYGDAFEKNGGNDTAATASMLGDFTGADLAIGSDANMGDTVVEIGLNDIDFFSIDDNDDVDFFEFTVNGLYDMVFSLEMVGPEYSRGPQNGTQNPYDLAARSDLDLVILASDGITELGSSAQNGMDVTESIMLSLDTGTYFARITGRDNAAQFYEFRATGVGVPESGSMLVLALLGTGLIQRRRRNL